MPSSPIVDGAVGSCSRFQSSCGNAATPQPSGPTPTRTLSGSLPVGSAGDPRLPPFSAAFASRSGRPRRRRCVVYAGAEIGNFSWNVAIAFWRGDEYKVHEYVVHEYAVHEYVSIKCMSTVY
jgi:hypothetical protein